MPYVLLNYYKGEGRDTACRPLMVSETAEKLNLEIIHFIKDGHNPFIVSLIQKTEYHVDAQQIEEWMKNPKPPLHVATETYKRNQEPLIFELILTQQTKETPSK